MLTTKNKILAYLLTIISFAIAVLLYLEADSKGYPDGHLTELDKAERPLLYASSILSLLTGLFLLYLARFNSALSANKIFYRTLAFLFLAILITGGIDWFLTETLDNGIGG